MVSILLRTAQVTSPIAYHFGLESKDKAKSASLTQFRKLLDNFSTYELVNNLEFSIHFQHI